MTAFDKLPFGPTELLLPQGIDFTRFAVIACDQYTSQPDYWRQVEQLVGDAPSALRMILPEYLLHSSTEADVQRIHSAMADYVNQSVFTTYPSAMIYVERTDSRGRLRRGLVGGLDLAAYDFAPGSRALCRATEETVPSRVPPRAAVRRGAALETSHVMLLCNDAERTVHDPLALQTTAMTLLYDFDLMLGGGHLKGWLLGETQLIQVAAALDALQKKSGMLFAVGDGNHSLAAAKALYAEQPDHPQARYALCELVNLYDESLVFEPIHRVVFHIDRAHLQEHYVNRFGTSQPRVGPLQDFLDDYTARFGGEIDYIHEAETAQELGAQQTACAFLCQPLGKDDLFPLVEAHGVLPRKTFSMGHADDKRFYVECRRI